MDTCPCNRHVPLDYSGKDAIQANIVKAMIARLGEFMRVTRWTDNRTWLVSRHCIALHGVEADKLESYGFDEVPTTD